MGTSSYSWPRRVAGFLFGLVAVAGIFYLALNLVAIHIVSVATKVEIDVEVVDGESGAPIPGAALHRSPALSDGDEPEAHTRKNGIATIETVAIAHAWWMLPSRGEARLRSLALHISADSFAPQIVSIEHLKVALPCSRPVARIRVALRRR